MCGRLIAANMRNEERAHSRSPYYVGCTTLTSETSLELPVRGSVPAWLTGTLVRTGPARFEVGNKKYNHWFDGLAMLHKFAFANGHVWYANRYLRSQAYRNAMAKGTISEREFATEPCRSLFQRIALWFSPKVGDNACVNIAQFADAVVALTETRLPVRFDARHASNPRGTGVRPPYHWARLHCSPPLRPRSQSPLQLRAGLRPAKQVSLLQHRSEDRSTVGSGNHPRRTALRMHTRSG